MKDESDTLFELLVSEGIYFTEYYHPTRIELHEYKQTNTNRKLMRNQFQIANVNIKTLQHTIIKVNDSSPKSIGSVDNLSLDEQEEDFPQQCAKILKNIVPCLFRPLRDITVSYLYDVVMLRSLPQGFSLPCNSEYLKCQSSVMEMKMEYASNFIVLDANMLVIQFLICYVEAHGLKKNPQLEHCQFDEWLFKQMI